MSTFIAWRSIYNIGKIGQIWPMHKVKPFSLKQCMSGLQSLSYMTMDKHRLYNHWRPPGEINLKSPISSCCLKYQKQQESKVIRTKEEAAKQEDLQVESEESLSLFKRFKKAYKEHGKVLIGVHCVTSAVWFSSFYFIASSGLDIAGFLEGLGASETLLKPFKSPLGNIAAAYLMYKIATPARYTVTLAGTKFTIDHLKKKGHIQPVAHQDKLTSLYKEGKDVIKDKGKEVTQKIKDRRQDGL